MIRVRRWEASDRFARDLRAASADVQAAVRQALQQLTQEPIPRTLRLHRLTGLPRPAVWKIDVYSNHAWQVTFELDGDKAILKRLGTHKSIDRQPR